MILPDKKLYIDNAIKGLTLVHNIEELSYMISKICLDLYEVCKDKPLAKEVILDALEISRNVIEKEIKDELKKNF